MAEPGPVLAVAAPGGATTPASLLHGIDALRPDHGPLLVVVGVFDGLHRGHAYLLRELRRAARRVGAVPAVLTFDHHPDEIMAGAAPPLLCDPEERLVRLARGGVRVTIVEHFDEALRRTPYDVFVEKIRSRTGLAGFLMTPDAAFGHERRGTPSALAVLGARDDFTVVVVPPFDLGGRQVRSTEIRTAIAAGDLATARELLGRRVAVTGEIADRSSDAREATLAFEVPVALPPPGPYAATLEPAIAPGGAPARPSRAVVRVATDGTLRVDARNGTKTGGRLRVSFVRPA
ncbi:MAG TPA: FAD synthetase family protein [Candidatus Limnocylindrales bacterium]